MNKSTVMSAIRNKTVTVVSEEPNMLVGKIRSTSEKITESGTGKMIGK